MLRKGPTILPLLFLAVAGVFSLARPAEAFQNTRSSYWFPLERGNRWVLRDPVSGVVREIRCERQNGSMRFVTGLLGGDRWVYQPSAWPFRNTLYVWNPDQSRTYPLFRFGLRALATPWRFDLTGGYCDTFDAHWQAEGLTIVTPAGTFYDCRQLDFTIIPESNVFCAHPETASMWFAPGVGPVKLQGANGELYELSSAVVGRDVYPAVTTGPFDATVASDQASYVSHPNTIYCIRAPCPTNEQTAVATFTFTVTNRTNQTLGLDFSSGQQFDFEIVDSGGNVVAAWSDGRMFTMALTHLDFAPGQTRVFRDSMELRNRDGSQLSGTFTVRARLTTASWSPVQGPDATTTIQVVIQ